MTPQDSIATAAGGQDAGNPDQTTAPADLESRAPLASQTPVRNEVVGGDTYRYPVTNPATFAYPPDYHQRLQSQSRGRELPGHRPAPVGTGQDDRQPSTARLQPRIEPPPTR
jgi:hypothetical protein